MSTNGIISIVKDGKTVFKCIAGCNGMTAAKTAEAIKKLKEPTIDQIYKACLEHDFGCEACTVVQSEHEFRYVEEDWIPTELYLEKFSDPAFNPRWDCGLASHTEIIEL